MIRFRLIPSKSGNAYHNMAMDEAVFKEVSAGKTPPTLRFYTWEQPSISIGYFQNPLDDLNLSQLKKKKIPWVRRITGGRGIYHHLELTYSFSSPLDAGHSSFPNDVKGTYHKISQGFLKGLQKLGLPVQLYSSPEQHGEASSDKKKKNPLCFSIPSWYEMMIEGKKLIGSAQKRYKNGFLQQGSILLSHRLEDFKLFFQLSSEYSHSFIGIYDYLKKEAPLADLETAFISGFEEAWEVQFFKDDASRREKELAQELICLKYGTDHWNLNRITHT